MFYTLKLSFLAVILPVFAHLSIIGAPAAGLAALGGASPASVASFFGATYSAPTTTSEAEPCSEGVYTFSGGTATVQFCRDRAYSFLLSFEQGTSTAEALLSRVGLSMASPAMSGLVLTEEGPGHRQWTFDPDVVVPDGVVPAERLIASQGPTGWSQLLLDFPSAP